MDSAAVREIDGSEVGSRNGSRRQSLVRGPWPVLGAALLAQIGFSIVEQSLPLLTGYVKQDLEISTAAAGLLVTAYFVGKTVGAYPAGLTADRVGETRILVAGGIAVAVALAAGMAAPLPLLLLCVALAGLASAAAAPAGGSLIRHAFAADRRGFALSVRQSGIPLGGLVAALLAPAIAHAHGWRTALAVTGILTALLTLPLLAVRAPRPEHEARRAGARARAPGTPRFGRDVKLLTLWGCILVVGQFVLLIFLPLDLHERRGVSLATGAAFVAVAQVAGVLGRLGWGLLSDRTIARGRKPVMLAITWASIAGAAFLALVPGTAPAWVWIIAAVVGGLTINGYQGLFITMVSEAADSRAVGEAIGFSTTFVIITIAVVAPLFGGFADLAGTYRVVWVVLTAVLTLAVVPSLAVGSLRPPKRTAAA